jgi:phosphoenolpyruvate carboxylase
VLSDSLKNEGSTRLVDNIVKDLIRLAETFGFHLATLDVRQVRVAHTLKTTVALHKAVPSAQPHSIGV